MNTTVRSSLFACLLLPLIAQADEHLFGYTRTTETLPQGHFDLYQFTTLRTGKEAGRYRAWDFDTEVEYGFTDRFQMGVGVVQHYFHIRDNTELENTSNYQFGGVDLSAKYRLWSPFKDPLGVAVRFEAGYLEHDDVAGLAEEEIYLAPEILLQKNFFDDTLIIGLNAGFELAWGKKPAEQYDYELALEGAFGVSYRFAPNWFIGIDSRIRSEFPEFDFHNHEHTVVFTGPALHYGAKRWWATLSWGYQVYGNEVDAPVRDKAYAEESRNEYRLKVGFNF